MKSFLFICYIFVFLTSCASGNYTQSTIKRSTAANKNVGVGLPGNLEDAHIDFLPSTLLRHLPTENEYITGISTSDEVSFLAELTAVANKNNNGFFFLIRRANIGKRFSWPFTKTRLGYLIENATIQPVLNSLQENVTNGDKFFVEITGKRLDKITVSAKDKKLYLYYLSPTNMTWYNTTAEGI